MNALYNRPMAKEKKLEATKKAASDCVFCKIANKKMPVQLLYEDAHTAAFFTMAPLNIGHSLVVPKKHFENIYDTDEKTLAAIINTVKQLAITIKKETGADGINVFQNNEYAAGQRVFHIHFHVIPRHEGDGFKHWEHIHSFSEKDIEVMREKIKTALS